MTKQEVQIFTEDQFRKLNIQNWKLVWLPKRNPFGKAGSCNLQKRQIELQPNYVEWNSEENIKNTILHEIAHALTPKHNHNKFWRRKAIEIGCTGERCYSKTVIRKM